MVIAVEQTVAKVGKLLGTNSLCVGASLGGAEPKSAIFRRFVRANNELHERAKGGGGGGGGNEVGNRETSRGRGPEAACLFRPRKFDPLFSYLIYYAPFPSNTGKCPSRPCAEIRVEISGQFYKFFFISQKREVLEKFRGIIFGGNSCGGIFISRWSIFFFFFLRSKECKRWFECENSRTKRDMTILYL